MFKKTVKSVALLLVISMLSTGMAVAATPTPKFTDPNGIYWHDVSEEADLENAYLDQLHEKLMSQRDEVSDAQLKAVGQYRLKETRQAEQPLRIYWDDERTGKFINILGYSMTVFGYVFDIAQNVVTEIALTFGQVYNDIAQNGQTRARTGHSYTYLIREGQVETSSGWQTFYIATSREVIPQTYALYEDVNGHTRQNGKTYTYALTTQHSPNYNNTSHISWQALNRWGNNLNCGREDWTGIYPDPDPQFIDPKKMMEQH